MKAINTTTEGLIVNDNLMYASSKNATVVFTLKDKNEEIELVGFSKVVLKGNQLALTK